MTWDAPSVTRSKAYSQPMWAAERILELESEVEHLRFALERVAEYHGEWVEEDPLTIRDFARATLQGPVPDA